MNQEFLNNESKIKKVPPIEPIKEFNKNEPVVLGEKALFLDILGQSASDVKLFLTDNDKLVMGNVKNERIAEVHEIRKAIPCEELLKGFDKKELLPLGKKLSFDNVSNRDVYNISKPFSIASRTVLTGRVEDRNGTDSEVKFFELNKDVWRPAIDSPTLKLEDGFAANIKGEVVIGGVYVYADPTEEYPNRISYRTDFYRGTDLSSLNKFASGPEGMKDIRLIALDNNKIGVFTRPQGGENAGGRIGYIEINSLEELTPENILKARIIENQFSLGEWGGANELHLLADGNIGVLGHIACRDKESVRHYYASSFVYNPKNHQSTPVKIIATRKNFPDGGAKIPELQDVVFPGGLVFNEDASATLFAGLSDAEAGTVDIANPFLDTNFS